MDSTSAGVALKGATPLEMDARPDRMGEDFHLKTHMASDLQPQSFVMRLCPPFLRPYVLLARLDRPVPILLLMLPGLWGLLASMRDARPALQLWVIFALGAFLMRSAGCVINDLTDARLDARVARTSARPLAKGDLTRMQALRFLAILLTAALGLLFMLPPVCWAVGVLGAALVTLYPWAKRVTGLPQIVLALTYSWGVVMASFATHGALTKVHALLYGVAVIWVFIFDTLYAHQDKEDDAVLGLGSSALTLGASTKPILLSLIIPMGGLAFWAGVETGRTTLYFAAVLVGCASLAKTIRTADLDAPDACKRAFQTSQVFGWMLLVGLMFD